MRTLLTKAFSSQIAYPGNFIGFIVVMAFSQLITLLFLFTVYTYTDDINGWTFEKSAFVFYLAMIVVLTSECFTSSIDTYFRTLAAGRLDPFLALPVRRVELMVLRWSEPGYLIPVAALLLIWPAIDPRLDRPLLDWLAGCLALGVGVLAIGLLFALISLATLLTQRHTPADFMVAELSRMLFLPVGVYPGGIWRVLIGIGFPMLFSAGAAGAVLVEGSYVAAIALAAGTLLLALVHRGLERVLLRRFSYPGS